MHPKLAHWLWLHQDKLPTLTYQQKQTAHMVGSLFAFFGVVLSLIAVDAQHGTANLRTAHASTSLPQHTITFHPHHPTYETCPAGCTVLRCDP